jgi:putative RecB family exonuclease
MDSQGRGVSVLRPDHLSASGWGLWETCPSRWRAEYVEHRENPAGWQAEVGTFTHRDLELVMRYEPERRTTALAHFIAQELWISPFGLWDGAPMPPSVERGEITAERFKREAWWAIQGLWEPKVDDPAAADVVATEQRIEWTEGDVPMVCVIDRVDRVSETGPGGLGCPGLQVLDYKAGKLPKPKYQAKPKRQITIGALALASTGKETALQIAQAGALLYVGEGVRVGAPTSREARRAVSEQAQQAWAAIGQACAEDDFPATVGPLCQWCPLVAECREGQSHIRRQEAGVIRGYQPDSPGAKVLAALDAA